MMKSRATLLLKRFPRFSQRPQRNCSLDRERPHRQWGGTAGASLAFVLAILFTSPAAGQNLSLNIETTPSPAAPGGRLAYTVTIVNQSTEPTDALLSFNFDPRLTLKGTSVPAEADVGAGGCFTCDADIDCSIIFLESGTCNQNVNICDSGPFGSNTCISPDDGTSNWSIGRIQPGHPIKLILEFQVDPGAAPTDTTPGATPITTEATLTGYAGGQSAASQVNVQDRVAENANMSPVSVILSHSPAEVEAGEVLSYHATVSNRGVFPRNLTLSLELAENLTYDTTRALQDNIIQAPRVNVGNNYHKTYVSCLDILDIILFDFDDVFRSGCFLEQAARSAEQFLEYPFFEVPPASTGVPPSSQNSASTGDNNTISIRFDTKVDGVAQSEKDWATTVLKVESRVLQAEFEFEDVLPPGLGICHIPPSASANGDCVVDGVSGDLSYCWNDGDCPSGALCENAVCGDHCPDASCASAQDSKKTEVLVCQNRVSQSCEYEGIVGQDGPCPATCRQGGSNNQCVPDPCPQACQGQPDGTSCNQDDDVCTMEECQAEECKPKIAGVAISCEKDSDCPPVSPHGQGACTSEHLCERSPQKLLCLGCEICDPYEGCELNTEQIVCRQSGGPCDPQDKCDGIHPTCPREYDAVGALCDDGDPETVDDMCAALPAPVIQPPMPTPAPDPSSTSLRTVCMGSALCGNSQLNTGEDCDDGNQVGGDCCSPACTFEPAGTSCSNGDMCDGDEQCDGSGTCGAGIPLTCDAGSICASATCDSASGCVFEPTPESGCEQGFKKGVLFVNETREGYESLKLRLKGGPALEQSVFGDPTAPGDTGYTVCFYRNDSSGGLAGALEISGGLDCGKKPCWTPVRNKGYRYRDPSYASDGVGALRLMAGPADGSHILLDGRNNLKKGQTSLPAGRTPPELGVAPGLLESFQGARVQIRRNDGAACFESTLPRVIRSGPTYFKAKQ